jgi:hypothetical protein
MHNHSIKAKLATLTKVRFGSRFVICLLSISVLVMHFDYISDRGVYLYPNTNYFIWILVPIIVIAWLSYFSKLRYDRLVTDTAARDSIIRNLQVKYGPLVRSSHWRFYYFSLMIFGLPVCALLIAFAVSSYINVVTRLVAFIPLNRVMLIHHIHVNEFKGNHRLGIAFSEPSKPGVVAIVVSIPRSKVDLKNIRDTQKSTSFTDELACIRGFQMPWGLVANEVISATDCTRVSKWDAHNIFPNQN